MPVIGCQIVCSVSIGVLAFCCAGNAEKVTVSGGRPVDKASSSLEEVYGWPISYEDPPRIYEGDLEDATSRIRKDGKSADEPGVNRILLPREQTFSFTFDPPPASGARAPVELVRAAILNMLESYSASVGGLRLFALTETNGIFQIVPAQQRDASGKLEKIVPLLDRPVAIPAGTRSGFNLVRIICESLSSQSGSRVGIGNGATNLLQTSSTSIASAPNESARSILSRFFAEVAAHRSLPGSYRYVSWHVLYQPGWGYALNFRLLRPQN